MKRTNEASVVAVSHIAVSSTPPQYPPNIGICSIMMVLPLTVHPASMFSAAMSTFNSLSCEHSWESQGLIPVNFISDARRPAADSGVSGPYMAMYGLPALIFASFTPLISAMSARISYGVFVIAG